MKVYVPDLAADGTNWAAVQASMTALQSAFDAVTLGNLAKTAYKPAENKITNVIPTTGEREEKVLVTYQDDVTLDVKWFTMPCRDRSKFPWVAGSDYADINDTSITEFTNLISALNTHAVSPDGNAITVISFEKVGRNT